MDITEIDRLLIVAQAELARLDAQRLAILEQLNTLKNQKASVDSAVDKRMFPKGHASVSTQSPAQEKISLFRSLFRGSEDVYAKRFESKQTGKSGYQPACRNEWVKGVCGKPKVPCGSCNSRELLPITDEVIKNHLQGIDPNEYTKRDFIIGVYRLRNR